MVRATSTPSALPVHLDDISGAVSATVCHAEDQVRDLLSGVTREFLAGRHVRIGDYRCDRDPPSLRLPAVVIISRQSATDSGGVDLVQTAVYAAWQLAERQSEADPEDTGAPVLHFGMHKGQQVDKVPLPYLRWLKKNVKLTGSLRRAVAERLCRAVR